MSLPMDGGTKEEIDQKLSNLKFCSKKHIIFEFNTVYFSLDIIN